MDQPKVQGSVKPHWLHRLWQQKSHIERGMIRKGEGLFWRAFSEVGERPTPALSTITKSCASPILCVLHPSPSDCLDLNPALETGIVTLWNTQLWTSCMLLAFTAYNVCKLYLWACKLHRQQSEFTYAANSIQIWKKMFEEKSLGDVKKGKSTSVCWSSLQRKDKLFFKIKFWDLILGCFTRKQAQNIGHKGIPCWLHPLSDHYKRTSSCYRNSITHHEAAEHSTPSSPVAEQEWRARVDFMVFST